MLLINLDLIHYYKYNAKLYETGFYVCNYVGNILFSFISRHWISKHSHDFWSDERLRGLTMDFLKEIESSPGLLPAEHKAAAQLLRLLERAPDRAVDLKTLFVPPPVS